jgi:hypothetical protein
VRALVGSRKFWIAFLAMICVTLVVIVCLLTHATESAMVTLSAVIGGLAFKLIDAIAKEDVADKGLQQAVQLASMRPLAPPPGLPLGIEPYVYAPVSSLRAPAAPATPAPAKPARGGIPLDDPDLDDDSMAMARETTLARTTPTEGFRKAKRPQ